MIPSLAERLRTETRDLHTAAERTRFMRVLLRGEMTRDAYAALLHNLHAIYAALEPALARHASHPQIAPIVLPGLARTQSLEDDLVHWHGRDWREALPLQPATEAYVRRLHDVEMTQPGLLLAHAYVRYLGDLSGGQMLRKIVGRTVPAQQIAATTFYEFGDAGQTRALTHAFRDGLGRIALDAESTDTMVEEAMWSFRMHRQLFHELSVALGLTDESGEDGDEGLVEAVVYELEGLHPRQVRG